MRRVLLIGAVLAAGVAGGIFFLLSGDDEPAGPPHYSIFDRPAGQQDRAPENPSAGGLRTEEQTGELRAVGEMRGHRFYLSRDDPGLCSFIHDLGDGSTGSGCSSHPSDFNGAMTFDGDRTAITFLAVPDGYTKARVVAGAVLEDRLMENGYAAAFREGPVTVRFDGSRGERTVELRGWP